MSSLLAFVGAAQLLGVGGCDNQGEGERCTFFAGTGDAGENGTDECSAGLVCTMNDYYMYNPATLGGAGAAAGALGVCCPPPGTTATVAACMPNLSGSMTGGRPSGDGSFDGGHDAGKEGGKAEAGKDAAKHDAPAGDATHPHDGATSDAHKANDGSHDARTD